MPEWTTFDEETSSALRARLPGETVIELPSDSAMEHALQRGEAAVAVLPAHGLGQAGLAVFRWNRIPVATPPPESVEPAEEVPPVAQATEVRQPSRSVRATGFLGLTDEVYEDEEEPQEKKSWWKRFWEE